ncbi:MAG: hypothetical protein ABIU54_14705 [Candidatus Eisenbacteria bacterium]
MRSPWFTLIVAAALASMSGVAHAQKHARKVDLFTLAPDYAQYGVQSVAFLPVATFDGSLEARRLTEATVGQALRGAGYRWVSPTLAKEWLGRAGGDSLQKALNDQLLRSPRLDSLQAPMFSRIARTRALLTVRVDQFERRELEFNQSGRPATTVSLKAALVDSSGRLLWSAAGSETVEGPFQDPTTNPLGVKSSGLNNMPITGQGGAPTFIEVLNKLLARWAEHFPARPAVAIPAVDR